MRTTDNFKMLFPPGDPNEPTEAGPPTPRQQWRQYSREHPRYRGSRKRGIQLDLPGIAPPEHNQPT